MQVNESKDLFSELKTVKFILQVFTLLKVLFLLIMLLGIIDFDNPFVLTLYSMFLFYFLSFIWLRMPVQKIDKIGETILILLFGIFALWMWLPDKKELKNIIERNRTK